MNIRELAKKIHEEAQDPTFESFIVNRIMSDKDVDEKGPYFSFTLQYITIDVWKYGVDKYKLVKSTLPGPNNQDECVTLSKEQLLHSIQEILNDFLK